MIAIGKKFWSLPRLERVTLPAAYVLLGVAYVVIRTVPFRQLVAQMGEPYGTTALVPLVSRRKLVRARRVGWVVQTAARLTPWPSNCFAQALVCALFFRQFDVPHGVYFGVAKSDADKGGLEAHAWVVSGPLAAVGGPSFERYGVVGCWVWWAD